ncbi:MAG: hypothetical protein Q4C95_06580 [Planctomycetia bacterium]|nr:hypothetical protein [Planctomycetia bacterium]
MYGHNAANELVTIGNSNTYVATDPNGNMTKVVKPFTWASGMNLTYDAWNRLVTVKDADNITLIAEYQYNPLNHRVLKKTYTNGTLTETRTFYYNRNWQCLEEYVGTIPITVITGVYVTSTTLLPENAQPEITY